MENPNPVKIEPGESSEQPDEFNSQQPQRAVIELGSSEDEVDWANQAPPGFPYGPPLGKDGKDASRELRRSKRIWAQVDKNNGKRVRYFPEKRKRRRHN